MQLLQLSLLDPMLFEPTEDHAFQYSNPMDNRGVALRTYCGFRCCCSCCRILFKYPLFSKYIISNITESITYYSCCCINCCFICCCLCTSNILVIFEIYYLENMEKHLGLLKIHRLCHSLGRIHDEKQSNQNHQN
eukprot:Sdes_comp20988_c0_seq112m19586